MIANIVTIAIQRILNLVIRFASVDRGCTICMGTSEIYIWQALLSWTDVS